MLAILRLLAVLIVGLFKSRRRLEAEILFLPPILHDQHVCRCETAIASCWIAASWAESRKVLQMVSSRTGRGTPRRRHSGATINYSKRCRPASSLPQLRRHRQPRRQGAQARHSILRFPQERRRVSAASANRRKSSTSANYRKRPSQKQKRHDATCESSHTDISSRSSIFLSGPADTARSVGTEDAAIAELRLSTMPHLVQS